MAPRRALGCADAGEGGGKDALVLAGLAFLCGEARALFAAGWAAARGSVARFPGFVIARAEDALGDYVLLWIGAWIAILVAAGRRRSPSRDWDLAAVAWVPFLFVDQLGALAIAVRGRTLPRLMTDALGIAAMAWTAVLVILAILVARSREVARCGASA